MAMRVLGAAGIGVTGVTGLWYFSVSSPVEEQTWLIPARDYTDLEAEKRYPSKYTFVLDMDETLLHTSFDGENSGKVAVRSFASDILKSTAACGEMVLWTAGTEGYAKIAIKLIGPECTLFHHRLYRNHLWFNTMGLNNKPLRRLERNRDYTLLVDNHTTCVDPEDLDNAIVVSDFFGDKFDAELRDVKAIIEEMAASGKTVPEFLGEMVKAGRLERLPSGHIHTYPSVKRSFLWF
eukprot:TRINITY_DN8287_c1_g2_i1.p1 TRINITY_DN8287_c1_g2~~TRINITY_DN8287_c1_g2_i1.p1  ORF type:complete len:264 (+),score=119.71 TRINITY_DN8287_c1_g2_i1:85-792(+)